MIRLIAIVVALLLALGGATAGLIHFGILPDVTGMIPKAAHVQEAEAEAAEAAEAEPPPPPPLVEPVYQYLPPLLIPLVRDGRLERSYFFTLRLLVVPGKEATVTMYHPRLHDAYLRAMLEHLPLSLEGRRTPDLEYLRREMHEIAVRLMGEGMIEAILFQAAFER